MRFLFEEIAQLPHRRVRYYTAGDVRVKITVPLPAGSLITTSAHAHVLSPTTWEWQLLVTVETNEVVPVSTDAMEERLLQKVTMLIDG